MPSSHQGLIEILGLEAAEVCYRGRAFRDGTIYSRAVTLRQKSCNGQAMQANVYGHRLGRSRRKSQVRKDGRLASKNSSIPVSIESEEHHFLFRQLPFSAHAHLVPNE